MLVLDSEYQAKKEYWAIIVMVIETKEVEICYSFVGKINYTLQIVYSKRTIKICGHGSRQRKEEVKLITY